MNTIKMRTMRNMAVKAIVSLGAICLIAGNFGNINTSWAASPADVSGHWSEEYVNKAISKGIVNGYSDGTFKPDRPVTRAEFISMANRALGNTGTTSISFPDVSNGDWYYSDVLKAVSAAYVAGYDDGKFLPNNPISRQEAAVMISRFVPTYGYATSLSSYSDGGSVADWAAPALSKICGKKYLGPYNDGLLHPGDQLTRAQTAKILCDIVDKETIVSSDPVIKTNNTTLSNKIYSNGVTVHSSLDEGNATIDNCVILGELTVSGGGKDTVTIANSRAARSTVKKSGTAVRVLAKGETTIVNLNAGNNSILETSSLSGGTFGLGFSNVSLGGSSETVFKGSFPNVAVDGSSAKANLESAVIDKLNVTSSGRNSVITSDNKSTIRLAVADTSCNFYGAGSITNMQVNASGVTYETKPNNWTIAPGVSTPTQQSAPLSTVFDPANAATGVKINAYLKITFSLPMTLYDKKTISNSDIQDFVTIKKGTSNGGVVKYSGTIDSAKRVITLDPEADLETDTRYYILITKNSMKDSKGEANEASSIYFNTEKNSSVTTFSPVNGKEDVALNTSITITFPEAIVRYSNGATLTNDTYLRDCFELKKINSSGSTVGYSATINSAKRVVTLTPTNNLDPGTKYYVALLSNKVKTDDKGTTIPSASVTWTTTGAPTVSDISATPGDKFVDLSAKANVGGRMYVVVVSNGSTAPTAAQVVAANAPGQVASANNSVSGGNKASFNFTNLATETNYVAYFVLRDSSSINSAVSSGKSFSTTKINLSSLSVGGIPFSFSPTKDSYDLTAEYEVSSVRVSASIGSGTFPGTVTINGSLGLSSTVSLESGTTTISVVVQETRKTAHTYTLTIKKGTSPKLTEININNQTCTLAESQDAATIVEVAEGATIPVLLKCEDPGSSIQIDNNPFSHDVTGDLTIYFGDREELNSTIIVTSSGATKTYYVKFKKAPTSPTEQSSAVLPE